MADNVVCGGIASSVLVSLAACYLCLRNEAFSLLRPCLWLVVVFVTVVSILAFLVGRRVTRAADELGIGKTLLLFIGGNPALMAGVLAVLWAVGALVWAVVRVLS